MALVCPAEGQVRFLTYVFATTSQEQLNLKLYSNNYTPVNGSSSANFTEVSNGLGYTTGGKALAVGSWTVTSGNPSYATYAQQTWTFTGSVGSVYGYVIVGNSSGKVYWAELFPDGPYNIQNNGDTIAIVPKITLT